MSELLSRIVGASITASVSAPLPYRKVRAAWHVSADRRGALVAAVIGRDRASLNDGSRSSAM